VLILSTHLHLVLFPSGFPTNNLYMFLPPSHSCYMPHPAHPPWLNYLQDIRIIISILHIAICLWYWTLG
jgi:hypothetical protein